MSPVPSRPVVITRLLDVADSGHVLVGVSVAGSEQIGEVIDGGVRLLTDLASDADGAYLPDSAERRDVVVSTADGGQRRSLFRFDADVVTDDDDPDEPHHDGPLVSIAEMTPLSEIADAGAVLAVDATSGSVICAGASAEVGALVVQTSSGATAALPVGPSRVTAALPSPDSTRLALGVAAEDGAEDLVVLDVSTPLAPVEIARVSGAGTPLGWSDAVQVICRDRAGTSDGPGGTLVTVDPVTGARQTLLRPPAGSRCAVSPAGMVLVDAADGVPVTRWFDVRGAAAAEATVLPFATSAHRVEALQLTPSGTTAVVHAWDAADVATLWTVDRDGGALHLA